MIEAEDFEIEKDEIYSKMDILPTEKMKKSMKFQFYDYKTFDILATIYA